MVVLNGLSSFWKKILAGVPLQGLLAGGVRTIFLSHIHKWLTWRHTSICKIFANDTFLFSEGKDSSLSLSYLNYDLETINEWARQRNISFNPDPNKQATEELFSRKTNSHDHPKLTFNGNQVQQCSSQKHLGLFLDNKLDFNKHLAKKLVIVTK